MSSPIGSLLLSRPLVVDDARPRQLPEEMLPRAPSLLDGEGEGPEAGPTTPRAGLQLAVRFDA
jgi:hypothetical protein